MSDHSSRITLPQKIVVIGGGTGNSTVISGFASAPFSGKGVTAIVNTFDDGGGAGELRKVYKDLPAVGDLRQCFDAMSGASAGARRILKRRFGDGDASDKLNVKGQTQGNLLIASALQTELENGGTVSSALEIVGELFRAKGKVVPASDDVRTLVFTLPDGTVIRGEHAAEESNIRSFKGAKIGFRPKRAVISKEANAAIRSADMVVLAPGDLYTSIGPNLVMGGMREALQAAKVVVMVSNLMNRNRHTVGFTTADYVEEYKRLIGAPVIDRVIYNTASLDSLDPETLRQQIAEGSQPVLADVERLEREGYTVQGFDLLCRETVERDPNDVIAASRSGIRHDSKRVAQALLGVYIDNGFAVKGKH